MSLPTLTSKPLLSSMRFSLPPLVSMYCFTLVLFSALIIIVTAQHHNQPQGTPLLSIIPEAAARNLASARNYKPVVLIHHARASLGVDKLVSMLLKPAGGRAERRRHLGAWERTVG